ncbi:histone deacetylase family protein [Phenylobacterium montanum]|uniref:Histone deacetylase family protein n=1 Tax=Phenylobacterium montanum TaxID=2823693 RepID=A0A975G2Q6_9CAUL|nr:histone deacetylase family protein [Caulobacter sp. S6]QUD89616.1 histone deacetylase family protein [Caulobacter sp. S6]
MKVFYSAEHANHSPESFYIWGQIIAFTPDPPARAENILEALKRDSHLVLEAPPYGLRPIAEVHTPEYLEYLQTAWAAWRKAAEPALATGLLTHSGDAYPLIFPVRGVDARYPSSALGRAGYHASDLWMPIGEQSWEAIAASANLAVAAAEAVLMGERSAYALCRPSGHHADKDRGGGNCYLNNAAIAAQHLRSGIGRVAVIDIDSHHGNGTQRIFYDRDDVLFISIHCDPDDCYPYFVGYDQERGEGRGHGYNLNLPLPHHAGDATFLAALETACARIAAYAPDALVVSLGVDGHEADPTDELKVTFDGFSSAGARLGRLGVPTVLVQEGGYNLDTIGSCVTTVLAGFERA